VKHATHDALEKLSALLADLRRREPLTERTPGAFYRSSRAFLHFHEDPAGLFADLRVADEWERFDVTSRAGRAKVLKLVDESLAKAVR
jgi:hypothetical protein